MGINIGGFLTKRAAMTPEREALVCEGVRRTYRQLNERANRLANTMRALGVEYGDRVGLLAVNEPEYLDMYFGLGKIGAILVPINHRLAGPEIQYILSDCGAKVLVFGEEFTPVVDSIREEIPARELMAITEDVPSWARSYEDVIRNGSAEEPAEEGADEDTLTILYTSGTTGRPKGAELTHTYYFWSSVGLMSTLGLDVGDTTMMALPLFHIGALAFPPWLVHGGGRAVLLKRFEPKRFLESLQEERVNVFGSVPQVLDSLKLVPGFEKYDWSSVKVILVYAAPVPAALIKEYAEAGIKVRQLYGLTECNTATVLDSENALAKIGSCGKPFFHTELRVVDENDRDVGPEVNGEVLLRAPNVMKCYWNHPEESEKALKGGWLHTGDMGRLDEDGFLYIMDRKKDMIISGGENIYPAEIENYLRHNPKVMDVAVIGYPHEKWGEAVMAIVVARDGERLTSKDVLEWCQGKIGKFKIPKKVVFADSIPRTPSGKILKRVLREEYS